MIFRLPDTGIGFPNPELAEEDGLLAVGGDLTVERLLTAYRNGIFPWYSDETPILWYSPHERFVIFPQNLKLSKSMRQVLRSGKFTVTTNKAFKDVVDACARIPRNGQEGTWITNDMKLAYLNLHRAGHAHSVEVWEEQRLVGGLYGVEINRVFCGESMFSRVSNASKTALIWLCQNKSFKLIDCQVHTEHLERMGAELITRAEYNSILKS